MLLWLPFGPGEDASFAIVRRIGQGWAPLISVPLILEYEAVGKRQAELLKIPEATVENLVRAFCFFGRETDVHFRLRPVLPDPSDEFLLDLAVAGGGGRHRHPQRPAFRGRREVWNTGP
jgi:hypothetical protein